MSIPTHPTLEGVRPHEVIDKTSPVPLHYQLERFLRSAIETGRFKAYETLPTEQELQEHFNLSRTPVRQAVNHLASEGLVVRRRSQGTVVLPKPFEEDLQSLSSFTEEVTRKGHTARARLLRCVVLPADDDDCHLLGVTKAARMFELVRVRYIDEEPVGFIRSHVPLEVAPNLQARDFEETGSRQSIYYVLETVHGLKPVRAVEVFDAVSLEEEAATLLNLPAASPILCRNRVTFDDSGRAIALERGYYRVRYRIEWGGRAVKHVDTSA